MAIPIRLNNPKMSNDTVSMGNIDCSFLANIGIPDNTDKIMITSSDKDAELLFKLWMASEKINDDSFKVSASVDNKDIIRLKTRGFLTGNTEQVNFTKKGKKVITVMALGTGNNFEKTSKPKSYTEILASMDKRGKKGYRMA